MGYTHFLRRWESLGSVANYEGACTPSDWEEYSLLELPHGRTLFRVEVCFTTGHVPGYNILDGFVEDAVRSIMKGVTELVHLERVRGAEKCPIGEIGSGHYGLGGEQKWH